MMSDLTVGEWREREREREEESDPALLLLCALLIVDVYLHTLLPLH